MHPFLSIFTEHKLYAWQFLIIDDEKKKGNKEVGKMGGEICWYNRTCDSPFLLWTVTNILLF